LGTIWRGLVGHGAARLAIRDGVIGAAEPIRSRAAPRSGEPWIAAVSRSHADARTEAFIAQRPGAVRHVAGSALKFCRVAAARAKRSGSAAKASRLSARPNRNSLLPAISQNFGLPASATPRPTSIGS